MERKEFNSLNEAALQVAMGITPEPEINEVDKLALEYFNNYFGDNLTEDTSDEDIMEAVYDLINLTEVVLSSVGLLDEAWERANTNDPDEVRLGEPTIADGDYEPKNVQSADKKGYLKPSPKQLKAAIKKRKENMEEPLSILGGGTVTGQDIETQQREKRIANIAKRRM